MGIFNKIFNDGKDLSKIAMAIMTIRTELDKYEYSNSYNVADMFVIAWICRVGIIDIIEKNNWPLNYTLYVPINGHQTKLTLNEAYLMSVGRLTFKSSHLTEEANEIILDILKKGVFFEKISSKIPESERSKYF